MSRNSYYAPQGGHPSQNDLLTGRAVFTEAYAVIPKGVMQDIATSPLPSWNRTRCWVVARLLSGFAETFSQYIMEVTPGVGSKRPEPDSDAGGVLFIVEGELQLTLAEIRPFKPFRPAGAQGCVLTHLGYRGAKSAIRRAACSLLFNVPLSG